MVEIALDTITIIGLFISIGGLIVVIFYNALKIKQNTKSQYYQILKDLNERFHLIQDNQNDAAKYMMHMSNFGLYIKELVNAKIIPKKLVLQQYKYLFGETLWILNRMSKENKQEKDVLALVKFCKDNNLKEISPPKWAINSSKFKDQ